MSEIDQIKRCCVIDLRGAGAAYGDNQRRSVDLQRCAEEFDGADSDIVRSGAGSPTILDVPIDFDVSTDAGCIDRFESELTLSFSANDCDDWLNIESVLEDLLDRRCIR